MLTDILLEPDDKLSSYHSLQSSDTDLETIVEHNLDTGIEYYDETESEEEYAQEEDREEDQDDLSAHALSNSSPMSSVLSDIETSIDIDAIDEDYANGDEYREDYEAGKWFFWFFVVKIHGVSKVKNEKVINWNPKLKVLNAKSDSEKLFSWTPCTCTWI